MQIIQDLIPLTFKNRPAGRNPMKYITIHNTGNASIGAGAKTHSNYLKSNTAVNLPVSWHYTVDDQVIYQHLPDAETAYHAGDGNGNGNMQSIGIEICENTDADLFKATENTVTLVASLCQKYNIPIKNVLQHNHWSGKDCPHKLRRNAPYSWSTFLDKVRSKLTSSLPPEPPASSKTPEEITVDNAIAAGIITDRVYWLNVLNNTGNANPQFVKVMMDNAVRTISTSSSQKDLSELKANLTSIANNIQNIAVQL
ncbi:MAG: N-acetylmuramoyl-L-alanine amidase [Defluviitaleaceae bacterium]|nr:N-acetylmuramoyl-L-alanine amidase [Defluviitaleaceae bacterium]